jgi:hypothetical protein
MLGHHVVKTLNKRIVKKEGKEKTKKIWFVHVVIERLSFFMASILKQGKPML